LRLLYKAYKKYLKLDEIPREFKGRVALLLRKVRSRRIPVFSETISGSVGFPITISMSFLNP